MSDHNTRSIFEEILVSLDIPESAYEKAEARYKDLGEWFDREESLCSPFSPHIYPQGSFRLGTVVRPVTALSNTTSTLAAASALASLNSRTPKSNSKTLSVLTWRRTARHARSRSPWRKRIAAGAYHTRMRCASISTRFLRSRRTTRSRRHSRKP